MEHSMAQNGAVAEPAAPRAPMTPAQAKAKTTQRSAGVLEQLLWRKHLLLCTVLALFLVQTGWELWRDWTSQPVEIFIHQVQVDAHGVVHPVGVPVPAAQYQLHDTQWEAFLQQWIRWIRPRNGDPVSTQVLWQLAANHTCDVASGFLNSWEQKERPFDALNRETSTIDQLSIKKLAPMTFTASWQETSILNHQKTVERIEGAFRMGRMLPHKEKNPMGVCVAWFDWPK